MDFTHCDSLEVTIGGEHFDHMLYEFILSYSGWRYVRICLSETAIMQLGHLGSCLTRSETWSTTIILAALRRLLWPLRVGCNLYFELQWFVSWEVELWCD